MFNQITKNCSFASASKRGGIEWAEKMCSKENSTENSINKLALPDN